MTVTPELEELAARSPDESEHRRDEPYRRALTGIYARLAATSRDARPARAGARRDRARAALCRRGRSSCAISRSSRRRSRATAPAASRAGRLRGLSRAAQVFGFHLAPLDLRQHSGVHEQVVAELFEPARTAPATSASPRTSGGAGCWTSWRCRGCCARRHLAYSEDPRASCSILDTAAELQQRYGAQALPNYIISKTNGASDVLEVALLLKEAGLLQPGQRAAARR